MRKIVLFIAALLFMAVPVMAVSNVQINCSDDDINKVTVSYVSDHNLIRAFGLDITVDINKITQVVALDPNYRIYPGQIVIVNGDVNDYGTCYDPCDLGDANVTIEMGSLYTTDPNYNDPCDPNNDWGYNRKPGLSGTLLKFYVGGDCNYVVSKNVLRGGIVMEDPTEEPNVTFYNGKVKLMGLDFGDAPESYVTSLPNGPRHPDIGPMLGANRDTEINGQPSADCKLDDTTGPTAYPPGDEDGVTAFVAVKGSPGSVTVTVSAACMLNAWIDWGNDGSFAQVGDKVFTNQQLNVVGPPGNVLAFAIPGGAVGNTPLVSRWRVNTAGNLDYYGPAPDDGEVEDYNKPTVVCNEPNVVHMTEAAATTAIQNAGFVCVSNYVNGGAEPIGQVVSQSPAPGAQPCGTTVTINVSSQCMKPTTTPASIRTDWVTWGKPRCWCYERNCRGDSDGIATLQKWVAAPDLALFKLAYLQTNAALVGISLNGIPGVCCDFDHLPTLQKRVGAPDLATFKTYYLQPTASVPVCVLSPNYYFWCTPPATCPANF